MNLILNNPYRILGLLVGATTREQTRQVSRLRQYIEAEQKPESDYSFEILGDFERNITEVDNATSQLNLNEDKMLAALFWFWNGKPITDEVALEALKDGDIEQALQIWDKLIIGIKDDGKKIWKEVTEKNFSAFHNYAVLGLVSKKLYFATSVGANLKFIDSDYFDIFARVVTDDTFNLSKKEIQLLFLNSIFENVDKKKSIELVKHLNNFNFSAKADYLKGFIQTPIENIERKITEVENKSKTNIAKTGEYGNELYNATKDDFELLKSILPNNDIKLINIGDKLSEALLDCAIAVFNHFHGTETEVGEIALELNIKAKSIAKSNRVITRIEESIPIVQEYIDGKELRQKSSLIDSDLQKLISIIDTFNEKSGSIENAELLINQSTPCLINIKNILGSTDSLYLQFSTIVANKAQQNIIDEVNFVQENLEYKFKTDRYGTLELLKSTLNAAWYVIMLIDKLDMDIEFKNNKYNVNKEDLRNLYEKVMYGTSFNNSKKSSNDNDFSFTSNLWWIFGLLGVALGLMGGLGMGCVITGLFGLGIGAKLSK